MQAMPPNKKKAHNIFPKKNVKIVFPIFFGERSPESLAFDESFQFLPSFWGKALASDADPQMLVKVVFKEWLM